MMSTNRIPHLGAVGLMVAVGLAAASGAASAPATGSRFAAGSAQASWKIAFVQGPARSTEVYVMNAAGAGCGT